MGHFAFSNGCSVKNCGIAILAMCGILSCGETLGQNKTGIDKKSQSSRTDAGKHQIDSIARLNHPKMLFEFAVGPSVSAVWREKYFSNQIPFWRYAAGLGFNYSLKRRFELGTKLLWETKGSRWENLPAPVGPFDSYSIQGLRLNYVTLTVVAQYFFDRKHRSYGGFGLSGGWMAHDETYTYFYDDNGKLVDYYEYGINDTFVRFEAGIIATAGYRIPLPRNLFLNFQLVGNLGITDIEVDFEPINAYPMSNANVMLLIGIGIPRTSFVRK